MFKKIAVFLFVLGFSIPTFSSGFRVPRPEGYIRDITHTLSLDQEASLELSSKKLDKKTGIQLAVLIVNDLDGDTVENAAVKTFEKWGIGQKGKDNGVLFLVALKEKKMRIEVGYGLEGTLPDGKAGAILDSNVVPYFKKGQLSEGVLSGYMHIAQHLDPSFKSQNDTPHSKQPVKKASFLQTFLFQNFMIMLLVIFVGLLIISPTFRAFFLLLLVSSRFGGGGGSSGENGFGGFGQGRSGGGGSSRGW